MKFTFGFVCALLLGFSNSQPQQTREAPSPGWVTEAKYLRHTDGDTAIFQVTRQLRIRFIDCWCAETDSRDPVEKRMGLEAKEYLTSLAKEHREGWIVEIPTDKMRAGDLADINTLGRWAGNVYLPSPDNRCVNDLLVEKKLAGKTKKELNELIEARRK